LQPLSAHQGLLCFEAFSVFLTAKDFVDREFQPGFLCVALYGSFFGFSWLIKNILSLT
jgi:hypothetical protein